METFEAIYDLLVALLDYPLGWMLLLGRDLPLVILAGGTAAVMLLLRKRVSDQALLGRHKEDRATLKARIRAAKAAGDKDLKNRLRALSAKISIAQLKAEVRPLLWALVPIILLASWAYARLGHVPPRSGEEISISAEMAPAKAGHPVYILPHAGMRSVDSLIQIPETGEAWDGETIARATWTLVFEPSPEPYRLQLRAGDRLQDLSVIVDRRIYSTPERWLYGDVVRSLHTHLEERRFLGIVPGFSAAFPPWIVAYVLLAIPFFLLFKRLWKIY